MYAIRVDHLSKSFQVKKRSQPTVTLKSAIINLLKGPQVKGPEERFQALKDVSFTIPQGVTVGIIGSNGSGKSTLLKLLAGLHRPNAGSVDVNGRVSALLELGAGFHPEFTGRENVFINGIILGLTHREIATKFDAIVRFAELEDVIDNPVKTYSSGMYMRLAFSVAVAVSPDVLLIDEILAVGDANFQHKCQNRMNAFKADGKTMVLVTHDLSALERYCDKVLWLEHGEVQVFGDVQTVMAQYLEHVADQQRENLLLSDDDPVKVSKRKRWGSREAEITAVDFFSNSRQPCAVYKTGDPMTIEMVYKAYQPVENPVFGIGIFRNDGTSCYGTNTQIEKIAIPKIYGEGTARFHIDRLDLTEGKHFLDVAIHDANGLPLDYQTHRYSFEVVSPIKDLGIYRPPHRWEFK